MNLGEDGAPTLMLIGTKTIHHIPKLERSPTVK